MKVYDLPSSSTPGLPGPWGGSQYTPLYWISFHSCRLGWQGEGVRALHALEGRLQ